MSLADLRSKTKTNLTKLVEEAKKETTKQQTYAKDERLWELKRDATGNAFALIRFILPAIDYEKNPEKASPWAKVLSHGFKDPTTGKWYIENSLTTIGKNDPVFEMNRELYNTKQEDQAKRQKRQTSYFANILVLMDPKNPDNEGKVFLFRFGKKIFDKISAKLAPSDEEVQLGAQPQDPFGIDDGMDFKLRIRTVDDYANYDLSEFSQPKPIARKDGKPFTEEELEKIFASTYSILEFYDEKNFKSYEDLKKRLDEVTGVSRGGESIAREPVNTQATQTQKASEEMDEDTLLKQIESDPPFEPDSSPSSSSNEEVSSDDIEKLLEDI